jgi:hypothetical protein
MHWLISRALFVNDLRLYPEQIPDAEQSLALVCRRCVHALPDGSPGSLEKNGYIAFG